MHLFVIIGIFGYLLGSLPFGLWIARAVAGVDLRTVGSGNIGATNVTRVVGKKWGAIALLLDAAKGAIPAGLLPLLLFSDPVLRLHAGVLGGLTAVLGHMFSPWLKFRGGKGVATATGVVLVLAPWGMLAALAAFILMTYATRIVSLGSLSAAIVFAIVQWWILKPEFWTADRWSLSAFSFGVPALIVFQHRTNIRRLLRGEEHAFRKKPDAASHASDKSA